MIASLNRLDYNPAALAAGAAVRPLVSPHSTDAREMSDSQTERYAMIEQQIRPRGIQDPAALEAMAKVPREVFLPESQREAAYEDRALPIGYGQTISQPFIVAYMTTHLAADRTCRILEVGTGVGYQTAILASLGEHVYSIERIDPLREEAKTNLERLGLSNVTLRGGDGSIGLSEFAPYDRILATAAAPRVPPSLVAQLVDQGRLVLPVGGKRHQTIVLIVRDGGRTIETPLLPCRFVKLIGLEGWEPECDPPT